MRTTITLEPEVYALVRRLMQERGLSFKDAVNSAIRAGIEPAKSGAPFRTRTFDMGEPTMSLDKALEQADALDDEGKALIAFALLARHSKATSGARGRSWARDMLDDRTDRR